MSASIIWHGQYFDTIFCQIFGRPSEQVFEYILYHDIEEIQTGDIPFGAKCREMSILLEESEEKARKDLRIKKPSIHEKDRVRVKICDLLEMFEFGVEEVVRGNLLATPIITDTIELIGKKSVVLGGFETPKVSEYIESVINKYGVEL